MQHCFERTCWGAVGLGAPATMPTLLQELRNCRRFTASTLEVVFVECAKRRDAARRSKLRGLLALRGWGSSTR
eukprot:7022214-Lingulodinium_polyedra.AAC.1